MAFKRDIVLVFKIRGDNINPAIINDTLGVEESEISIKGSMRTNPDSPRTNIWSVESTCYSDDIEKHWEEISDKIGHLATEIVNISNTGDCIFTVYIYTRNRIPPMCLPNSMVKFAGDVGACIDIDHLQ